MNSDEFLGGEYDNTADLMGIEGGDFLGQLAKQPKEKQADFLKKAIKNKKIILVENNSRFEMEGKFMFMPKEIKDGLLKKRLQLADTRFYVVKDIPGKNSIDIFQGTDNKGVGLANLANQKLEKDNWFVLSAIRVLTATSPDKESAQFGEPAFYVTNGEWELECGQKKVIGLMSGDAFDTRQCLNKQIGLYKFASTKLFEPQVEIKMPMKFAFAAPPTSWIKVVFIGTSVIPY